MLCQFPFNAGDQLLPLLVHLVLGIEKGASFLGALRLQCLDLFLPGDFLLQCQGDNRRTPRFLDLPVKFLKLPLQTEF